MHFLDIAVGMGYALICLALITSMGTEAPQEGVAELAAQSRLDSALHAYLAGEGLPFLTTASLQALCTSAAAMSNSTIVIRPTLDGTGCGGGSSPSATSDTLATASLAVPLPGRELVLQAWLVAR